MLSHAIISIISSFFALIVYIVLMNSHTMKQGPNSVSQAKMLKLQNRQGESIAVNLNVDRYCDLGKVMAVPIKIDDNGIPMIDIHLGEPAQVISVALDTASCDLVVSGSDCETCGNKLGKYNSEMSISNKVLDKCTTVTYGTQSDGGCWVEDTVSVVGKCIESCADVLKTEDLDLVRFPNVQFLVSKQRNESPFAEGLPKSDYSVFGLCHSSEIPIPVMRQVLAKMDLKFTLIIGIRQKWFVLGRIPKMCTIMYPLESVYHPEFYMVKCPAIQLGKKSLKLAPKKIIIDSGSNFMFVPSLMLSEMKNHKTLGKDTINLQFENFTLNIPPSSYVQDGVPLIHNYETTEDSIILGSLLLTNTAIEFDMKTRNLKIGILS